MEILINAKNIDVKIEEQSYSKPRLILSNKNWVIYIEDIEQIKNDLIDYLQDLN